MGDDEIDTFVRGVFGLPAFFLFQSFPHALKTSGSGAEPQDDLRSYPSDIMNERPSFSVNGLRKKAAQD